jgi:hypothetical protein
MSSEIDYTPEWRSYRRMRIVFFALVILWIPYGRLVFWFSRRIGFGGIFGLVLIVAYAVLLFGVGSWLALWRCPRCGKVFRGLRPYAGKYCYYCKLPKWSEATADGPSIMDRKAS